MDKENAAVLEMSGLCAGYGRAKIVSGVSVRVMPGEILTLIGPNGAGKSTVLKTVSGQIPPVDGKVFVCGKNISEFTPAEMAKTSAIVSTERIRPELMTAREVARQGRYPYTGRLGTIKDEDAEIVEDALRIMQCLDFADKDFNKLSDGQKQRVLIARAIAQSPKILILDEPTSFLDIRYQYELEKVLKKLAGRGMAVVMSLHELGMAMRISDRLIGIADGKMCFCDTPARVRENGSLISLFDLSEDMYRVLENEIGSVKKENARSLPRKDARHNKPEGEKKGSRNPSGLVLADGKTGENVRTTDSEAEFNDTLNMVRGADAAAMEKAENYISTLAMPPGSLGGLEDIAVRLAGITGKTINKIENARILVFCADNGVTEEGVSSAPRSVTVSQAVNMTKHVTGMSSMAEYFGDDVEVIDVGIAEPYKCSDIINCKVKMGTDNIAKGPAMTRKEAIAAITAGIRAAARAKRDGMDAVGIGEMGIGNTTTSSAVLSVLFDLDPEELTGRGGGITDAAFEKKKQVIRRAIEVNRPDQEDPIDVVSKVGGLDIAAMCGAYLGCAALGIPALCDGFISITAAYLAYCIKPEVRDYIFLTHKSTEKGYVLAAEALRLKPWLELKMRLGEGSGCVPGFEIMRAAAAFTGGMASFENAGINDDYLEDIRKTKQFQE